MEDLSRAFYWNKLSADAGNPQGQCNLALCYENGHGVEKNLERAIYWYELAAEEGNPSQADIYTSSHPFQTRLCQDCKAVNRIT